MRLCVPMRPARCRGIQRARLVPAERHDAACVMKCLVNDANGTTMSDLDRVTVQDTRSEQEDMSLRRDSVGHQRFSASAVICRLYH